MNKNSLFDSGNRFNRFLSHILDIIILGQFWLLCSLPIITVGASTIALYTMTLRLVRDEEGDLKSGFFKAFRRNFSQSLPVTLVFGALYCGSLFSLIRLLGKGDGKTAFLFGINIAFILVIKALWVWIVALIARYDDPLPVHLNNAWRLAVGYISYTLIFLVTTTAPLFWAVLGTDSFLIVLPIWFLMGGGGAAAVNSIYLRKVFDSLEKNT